MKKIISGILIILNIMIITSSVFAASAPTVSISGPNTSQVVIGGTVKYTVTFYNTSNINFDASYVGIAGSGVTAVKTVSGSGNVRTITLSNIQGPSGKVVSIAIKAGAATNSSGKSSQTPNSNAFTLKSGNYDESKPSIIASGPSVGSVDAGGSVSYNINYSDNSGSVTVLLNSNHIRLYGFSANISVTGSGNRRTITLSNIQGEAGGSKYIALQSGTARDAAGNYCSGIAQTTAFNINKKYVAPSNPVVTPAEPVKTPVKPTPAAPVNNNNNDANDTTEEKDITKPDFEIKRPDITVVKVGESYKLVIDFTDNDSNLNINLNETNIKLTGFTAIIVITGEGNTREVELKEIQKIENATDKSIEISAGVAKDTAGNESDLKVEKLEFEIEEKNKYDDGRPNDWIENPNTGREK